MAVITSRLATVLRSLLATPWLYIQEQQLYITLKNQPILIHKLFCDSYYKVIDVFLIDWD